MLFAFSPGHNNLLLCLGAVTWLGLLWPIIGQTDHMTHTQHPTSLGFLSKGDHQARIATIRRKTAVKHYGQKFLGFSVPTVAGKLIIILLWMLWKPWTQSQCNQGTDKQTEKKNHTEQIFLYFFFHCIMICALHILKRKMLHHAVVLSERHWVTLNIFQSREEIGCCCTGAVVFWSRASLVWMCRGSRSPTGCLKKPLVPNYIVLLVHFNVVHLLSGALISTWVVLFQIATGHFALTRSGCCCVLQQYLQLVKNLTSH